MIRQISLILLTVVLLAIGSSVGVGLYSTRMALQDQWRVRNLDAANMLALALSQQRGDKALMELVLRAQFDTGHYQRVSLLDATGRPVFERRSTPSSGVAPAWLVGLLQMSAPPGQAVVSDGWRKLGQVEVESQSAWAYDGLWAALVRNAGGLLFIGVGAMVLAFAAVRRWRQGLDRVLDQAHELEQGRFQELPEPSTFELKRLTAGMNAMVRRLHGIFDEHAAQLAALQRQVQTDGLTGLANRRHFLARLERALESDDSDAHAGDTGTPSAEGPRRGGLLLIRLRDIEALNVRVGHGVVDRLLAAMGEVLQSYPARVEGAFAGRLNGRDLVLYLPANGIAGETAQALRQALSTVLSVIEPGTTVCIGGVDGLRGDGASDALARADEALARAECDPALPVHVQPLGDSDGLGEGTWREQLRQALAAGRTAISEFPVVLRGGEVVHLECPLRVQLQGDGPFVRAARWLPMASRSHLMDQVDLAAAQHALAAIARDGRTRCVHVSSMALADAGFVRELERRLAAVPQAAGKLSIEVDETATQHWRRWRDAAERWRPLGVRLGIDNTGRALEALADARSYGVDYLKIDGRYIRGLAVDPSLADFARQIVMTARGLGVALYAEGVDDIQDLKALWQLGFDGATGPAVTASTR